MRCPLREVCIACVQGCGGSSIGGSADGVVCAGRQAGAPSAPPASPPIGADMLAMMEAQLGSLSGLIRQKDAEIAGLKVTVQRQCDERVEMLMALNEASKAGAGGAGAGGVGVGKGKAAQGEEEGPPGKGRGRGVSNTIRGNIGAAPGSPWRRKAGGWH